MTMIRGLTLVVALSLGLVVLMTGHARADVASAAEAEGSLTWYTAMLPAEAKALADEFNKLYPKIKVNFVVMRANQMPIRISTEQRAGKFRVDVTSASAWQIAALAPTGALAAYEPPEAKNLIPEAVDKSHQWFGEFVLTIPIVYNTKTLAAQNLKPPTSYQDLTKPDN